MSACWLITYLEKVISDDELFKATQDAFRHSLEGKLYNYKRTEDKKSVAARLDGPYHERFSDPDRARLVMEQLMGLGGRGILHFPQRKDLRLIADSITGMLVYLSGRKGRFELERKSQSKPDPVGEMLLHYMNFLRHLTKTLDCQAVHVMHERNPASTATGVHFYDTGEFVDSYLYVLIDAIWYEEFERISRPKQIEKILGGRFAFLCKQPVIAQLADGEEYAHFFGAGDLPPNSVYDIFNLNQTDLYVPFWEENRLPFGAIYCTNKEF